MSLMAVDQNSLPVQAFRLPASGLTGKVTMTVANTSYASAALAAGIYRIVCSSLTYVCSGAAPSALATDMPMGANKEEYFYINAGEKIAGQSAAAGATITYTRMP